ncbi:MAG TPA: DUF1318 domain-containing protein [Nitrospirota bacterium]|jgi:hypothetical protein
MDNRVKVAIMAIAALALSSCFSITVNVYFPAKDVKSAFKSLEEDLMKGGAGGVEKDAPEAPAAPEGQKPEPGDQSWLGIEFGPRPACAQGSSELSSELAEKLRSDPKVVAAYKAMGGRLSFIDRLRDQGVAGEGNNGMLAARGSLGKKESVAVDQENRDRNDIVWAMARAIVEINGQPVTNDSISQVLDKASGEFSAVRRDAAKPGWWVQSPDGSWKKK